MPRNLLSDVHARNAKPRSTAYRLRDGGGPFLYVPPSGVCSWQYRYKFEKVRVRLHRIMDHAVVIGALERNPLRSPGPERKKDRRHYPAVTDPEFVSRALPRWAAQNQLEMALIDPGKPWQNGVNESFNGKFRDECLSMEWFRNRTEAKAVISTWRQH